MTATEPTADGGSEDADDSAKFGMTVLTRSLDDWEDAWLVELDEPIRPLLRTYERLDSGIVTLDQVARPVVSHVVVNRVDIDGGGETLAYPAFASGEVRTIDGDPTPIAGGPACTHVDALHDLAAGYVGLECSIDGERCSYAMGTNQVIVRD